MRTLGFAAAIGLALFAAPQAQAAAFTDQVSVEGGALKGSRDGDILSFKGVPFAAPPVGDLRWRAPQAVSPWTGVRSAAAYGHDCMQKPFPSDAAERTPVQGLTA